MSASLELVQPKGGSAISHGGGRALAVSDRLDLSESITFFRRRLTLIAAITALSVLTGLLISLILPNTYRAVSTVMIEPTTNDLNAPGTISAPAPTITSELLETQGQIIGSREMAATVAKALGLDASMNEAQQGQLLDAMQQNVGAKRSGTSFALNIAYDARDPVFAAKVANQYASEFASWDMKAARARNVQARSEVEARLAELRNQAQADTQALQQYRIANNLLSTSGTSLTEQEISNYNIETTKARAEAAADEARLQTALAQLRSGSSGDDVGEALSSPVISSLRTQEAALAGEVANLSTRYGKNYPELIQKQGQLAEVRASIQAEIERVISNLRAKQEVSAQRLASLNASLGGARGKLTENNAAMVGLSGLERNAEASQGIYETYLARYKQLLAADGTEKSNARILTPAVVPSKPTSPNLKLNLALSLVIGLGLGVIAAYIAEALFHGVTSADEVQRDLGEHFLSSIPLIASIDRRNPHAIEAMQEDPKSVFTESIRSLGISIDHATESLPKVIAITSALPGEGKTVISCSLAHVLAESGERTVLIDCDFRRSGISRLLGVRQDQFGLREILDGSSKFHFDQMIGDRTFCIIPWTPSTDNREHLLSGHEFADFIAELRNHFDRIILDLPPILPVAATRTIARQADAVVLAVRWRKTSSFAIKAARSRLPQELVNVVGVALNQVDIRRRGYFDPNDVSYYYNQYKEYYA
ncbi:MAG: GumC family protein [Novosphingobium sp.]